MIVYTLTLLLFSLACIKIGVEVTEVLLRLHRLVLLVQKILPKHTMNLQPLHV